MFVDHVDEVHGFRVEAEKSNPAFEGHMFFLDLFDQTREQALHLFLQHEQFRNLCVGILANNVFQFTPQHLLAFLVEQRTFVLVNQSLFADEGWFAALGTDTDHLTTVAVHTLRTVFDWLAHCNNITINSGSYNL